MVILGVLIIPLFLGEPKNDAQSLGASVQDFKSKITPLPGTVASKSEEEVVLKRTFQAKPEAKINTPVAAEEKAESQTQKKEGAKLVPSAQESTEEPNKKQPKMVKPGNKDKTKSNPKPKPESSVATKEEWALQAGIFSKLENAQAIANILKSHGFSPELSEFEASFGKATRVWVGPYTTKSAAQAESDRLKEKTGDGGYVAPFPFSQLTE